MKHKKIHNSKSQPNDRHKKIYNSKSQQKDRVELICEAQPALNPADVRLLLVGVYYKLTREPGLPVGMVDGYLCAVTDDLIGLSPKEAEALAKRMANGDYEI